MFKKKINLKMMSVNFMYKFFIVECEGIQYNGLLYYVIQSCDDI